MMIVTVSTLSDLLIISCLTDLSIWEKIVFNDQNLCLDCFGFLMALFLSWELSDFALFLFPRARNT